MSRICPLSGKGPLTGNTRSHSLRTTRRRWNPNLQTHKVVIGGKTFRVRLSTHAYRTLAKHGYTLK